MSTTSPIIESCDAEETVDYVRTPWWWLLIKRKCRLKSRTPFVKDEGANAPEPTRGFWANECEAVLSLLGLAVGLGNVWRFPWMVWKNGGGAFLIPYTFMLLLCGIPLFLMELTLGQYSGCGPANVFEIAPLFKGLGWCVLLSGTFSSTSYITLISWAFYYMFSSFQSPLPWSGCQNPWNTRDCFSIIEKDQCEESLVANGTVLYYQGTCQRNSSDLWSNYTASYSRRVPATEEYFNQKMYHLFHETGEQRTMGDSGAPKWDLTLTLMFAWILTYLCVYKGVKSSGKVVYFTALFPYVAITALLVVAVRLDGASDGIRFYIYPNITKLQEPTVWVDAAAQIFYSLGIFSGAVMTYASYNKYTNNILRDCLIVGFGNSLTSFYAGFVIFSILGYMAKRLHTTVDKVIKSGSALAFVAYPEVVSKMPGGPVWSALFFMMLITLGLDSQFGSVETIMTAVLDKKPELMKKKWAVAAVICTVLFILGLSTVSMAGVYWVELLNYYGGWGVTLVALVNAIIYGWVYGAGKIVDHLQHMIGRKFPVVVIWLLLFAWKGAAPLIIIVIAAFNFYNISAIDYHGYVLPVWAQTLGWLTALVPLGLIPLAAVIVYFEDCKKNAYIAEYWYQRIARLTRPTSKWVPSYVKHKQDPPFSVSMATSPDHVRDYGAAASLDGSEDIPNGQVAT